MFQRFWIAVFITVLFSFGILVYSSGADDRRVTDGMIASIGNNMVLIPAGEFLMGGFGAADENPTHKVYLDDYYIGKYEVSFEEYENFCRETGRELLIVDFRFGYELPKSLIGGKKPIMNTSREDAEAYCAWLSKKTGKQYRLPTEAEWEKAARGGMDGKEYPWGNEPPDSGGTYRANFGPGINQFLWKRDGYENTAPVGSYPPNGYGLHDVAGNVWEWCQDRYGSDYYSKSPYQNPKGPSDGLFGVIRGGCYSNSSEYLRCAQRYSIHPTTHNFLIGFRIVRDP